MFAIKGTIEGAKPVLDLLRQLGEKVEKRVLPRALKKAGRPVIAAVRSALDASGDNDTRLTRRSIGSVARYYPSTGTCVLLIGPQSGFAQVVTRAARPGKGGKRGTGRRTQKADPRFTAHLIERGVKPHAVGVGSRLRASKRKGPAAQSGAMHPGFAGTHFTQSGWDAAKDEARDTLIAEVSAGTLKELAK
jgi:hypothetical protein